MKRMPQDELDWRAARATTIRCGIDGCPEPLVCVDTPNEQATELARQHRARLHPHLPVKTPPLPKPKPKVHAQPKPSTGEVKVRRMRVGMVTPERVQLAAALIGEGLSIREVARQHADAWGSKSPEALANTLSAALKKAGHVSGRAPRGKKLTGEQLAVAWQVYEAGVALATVARMAAAPWGYGPSHLEARLREALLDSGRVLRDRTAAKVAQTEVPLLNRGEVETLIASAATAPRDAGGTAPPCDTATASTADAPMVELAAAA